MGLFVINTSESEVVLAYGRTTNACKQKSYPQDKFLSENLAEMINCMLGDMKIPENRPNEAISVCVGPGGYTSLRIAITAAKMLSLSFSIPLIGIRSSDIYANLTSFSSNNVHVIALETNRHLFCVERFCGHSQKSLGDAVLMTAKDVIHLLEPENYTLAGSGITRLCSMYPHLETEGTIVHATSVLLGESQYALSREHYQQKLWANNPDTVQPIYFGNMQS